MASTSAGRTDAMARPKKPATFIASCHSERSRSWRSAAPRYHQNRQPGLTLRPFRCCFGSSEESPWSARSFAALRMILELCRVAGFLRSPIPSQPAITSRIKMPVEHFMASDRHSIVAEQVFSCQGVLGLGRFVRGYLIRLPAISPLAARIHRLSPLVPGRGAGYYTVLSALGVRGGQACDDEATGAGRRHRGVVHVRRRSG